jgi:hypothetical protein
VGKLLNQGAIAVENRATESPIYEFFIMPDVLYMARTTILLLNPGLSLIPHVELLIHSENHFLLFFFLKGLGRLK